MVHIIPLSVAQRRLDTGNGVQYPQGSPIGGAMQGLGDHLSAVAERYQQMKEQQEAFDAEMARRRFDGENRAGRRRGDGERAGRWQRPA
ncbi:hypothetical protein [Mesorhizobium sp. WSM3868]|uniref:hypothetical protein n=1 Tax=Mesorhizobium sp. WSM3868 TaxID=2029405 RepID=UPI0015CCB866|nr:hypothetical protein [Mesorhizobium sp. WSM3868]